MLNATTSDKKIFMNHLLAQGNFDNFLLCEATIMTGITYVIDGHINKDFYENEDEHITGGRTYERWSEIRPLAYQMIKGSRTPLAMKFVLVLAPENVVKFLEQYNLPISPEQVSGLYLNIRYENEEISLSSGTALSIFTMDKTLEHVWDDTLVKFFVRQDITLTNK